MNAFDMGAMAVISLVFVLMIAHPIATFFFNREIAKEKRYLDEHPIKEIK